jgi:EAL domain-containing protein (putative c-di-GMP-specific phosphodiesterase class I)
MICFPIRSTYGATLQGLELRSAPPGLGVVDARRKHATRQDCAPIDIEQLEWLLGECAAQPAAVLSRSRIWMPLAVRAIARPWVKALLGPRLRERDRDAGSLTIAFSQDDAMLNLEAFAHCAELLRDCEVRVAVSDVDDLHAFDLVAARAPGCIGDVRLASSFLRSTRERLADAVTRWHGQGMTVTALDLGSAAECEAAIEASVDLLQGDVVGLAYDLALLDSKARHSEFGPLPA